MFEYDSIIHHQDAATYIASIGDNLLDQYKHKLQSIKTAKLQQVQADPENPNDSIVDEHASHVHGTINHNNQARLTLLILNMAYLT